MVERADINSVLSEMRSLRAQMMQNQRVEQGQNITGKIERPGGVQEPRATPGFNDMLRQAVGSVNEMQQTANTLRTGYEMGDPTVDITRVMVASQKASVSFDALVQVRNRVVKAYEDIMNMPV
ncbi:MAG: flagellar hook-basal body complex protein FliE [Marinobacter sp.]|nr:flagellar hook-basal body complex protein FliE [Marinobacter sp.]